MHRAVPPIDRRLGLPRTTRACLFDLDGVLTQTAKVHAAAWKQAFDAFLAKRARAAGTPFVPFDAAADYARYVDGKLRIDGARAFLVARGFPAPDETVQAIAARKDELVLALLASQGVETYEGSVRYVRAVRNAGLRTAVVSSSKHCAQVLDAAGIADLFEARIDGIVIEARHLRGKPAPDSYLAAAEALAVAAPFAAVFEDALAGVEAGRNGGFGFVVGVDRVGQREALRAHGADVVVDDLAALVVPT